MNYSLLTLGKGARRKQFDWLSYIHVVVKPIHSQIYLDRYAHINVSLVYS